MCVVFRVELVVRFAIFIVFGIVLRLRRYLQFTLRISSFMRMG